MAQIAESQLYYAKAHCGLRTIVMPYELIAYKLPHLLLLFNAVITTYFNVFL